MATQSAKLTRRERDLRARIQADPLAWCVREAARTEGCAIRSATGWLQEIQHHADQAEALGQARPEVPKSAAQLSRALSSIAPSLLLFNVILSHHRTGADGRFWRAETVAHCEAERHFEARRNERRQGETAHRRALNAGTRAALSEIRKKRRRDARRGRKRR